MGFELGNQSWKRAASMGRDAVFSSPLLMAEAAVEYFKSIDENPWDVQQASGGKVVTMKTKVPYTWAGFCLFCGVNREYFRQFKEKQTFKDDPDFARVIEDINDVMFAQKFTGASIGIFNANIISRDLGLTNKEEVKHEGEWKISLDLSK